MRNAEAFCVRSKVLFLVPFGCHIFNELTNVIQFMLLTLKKKRSGNMRGHSNYNRETQRQLWTQGACERPTHPESGKIPLHPGCLWVCILADRDPVSLS